jgi:hypothetical protein
MTIGTDPLPSGDGGILMAPEDGKPGYLRGLPVIAVIVTYAERYNLIIQAIEALESAAIAQIVIVTNGISVEYRSKLEALQPKQRARIILVNLPASPSALRAIEQQAARLPCETELIAFSSLRGSRFPTWILALEQKDGAAPFFRKSSICTIDVRNLPGFFWRRIARNRTSSGDGDRTCSSCGVHLASARSETEYARRKVPVI